MDPNAARNNLLESAIVLTSLTPFTAPMASTQIRQELFQKATHFIYERLTSL
jgi:hypothetical protein